MMISTLLQLIYKAFFRERTEQSESLSGEHEHALSQDYPQQMFDIPVRYDSLRTR